MCEPTTIALAVTAVSGVVAAGGAVMQGQAQAKQAKYQAAVETNNATIAGWQAQDATQRGQIEEQRQRLATARLRGAQRAGMASNGVEIDSGSPLDVLMDTAQLGQLDALTIRSNAEREAYGLRNQQSNLTAQAGLTRMAGRSAQTAGYISAGSTLLSTAATAYDRKAQYDYYSGKKP
jgi:Zn-dependent metalloprotease